MGMVERLDFNYSGADLGEDSPCSLSPSTTSPFFLGSPAPVWATSSAGAGVTTAPQGYEGEGFPVRRAFAGVDLRDLDPFIHMDQMGEVEYALASRRAPLAPAPGLRDRDLHARRRHGPPGRPPRRRPINGGHPVDDRPGLLHIGDPAGGLVAGGLFHGVQLWVNLPRS